MEPKTLLDTDILSALMRKAPAVFDRARDYLAEHRRLTMSLVTRYEILRGLATSCAFGTPTTSSRGTLLLGGSMYTVQRSL